MDKQVIESKICDEIFHELKFGLIVKWYPLVIDKDFGGYFTNIKHDWKIDSEQEKMIVTQSRHIWTLAKLYEVFGENDFINWSFHGFRFIKDKMWDKDFGGFYQIRDREGNFSEIEGWRDEKRSYGNAFAIYALSALYHSTKNEEELKLAVDTFNWLEKCAHDKNNLGYFQFINREGKVFNNNSDYQTIATDKIEADYKDQNSSIHLLEAFTELYSVWKNELLQRRLVELLKLIRDKLTDKKGYLHLFFDEKWNPVSFRNSVTENQKSNYRLDHVSFGHDYETAYLMLEASYVLGLKDDRTTLIKSKQMLDHAIANGWDSKSGGFFDEGYYFDDDKCSIIKESKTWWIQAEGLNALLIFSKIFPHEKKYFDLFIQLWDYVKKYLIDSEFGGWYWGSLEKRPFYIKERKANIWKAAYHDGRALMNCLLILSDKNSELYLNNENFRKSKNSFDNFIFHWQEIAKLL